MGKKKKEPIILATWIMCPDGTMLPSFHNHDYREHTTIDVVTREHPDGLEEPEKLFSDEWEAWDEKAETVIKESRHSMVDGGTSPHGQRGGHFIEMSVFSTDPYEVIRRFLCRRGKGKDGREYLTWTPLFRINDEWLDALIEYETKRDSKLISLKYYKKEKKYRKKKNISVKRGDYVYKY